MVSRKLQEERILSTSATEFPSQDYIGYPGYLSKQENDGCFFSSARKRRMLLQIISARKYFPNCHFYLQTSLLLQDAWHCQSFKFSSVISSKKNFSRESQRLQSIDFPPSTFFATVQLPIEIDFQNFLKKNIRVLS